MTLVTDDERRGLAPSPLDALIEEVKRLRAENAALRAALEQQRQCAGHDKAGDER